MNSILACTDGSQYASSVYDHTAWAAQRLGAHVRILHMLDPQRTHPELDNYSGSIGLGAKTGLLQEIVELEASKARVQRQRGNLILQNAGEHLRKAGIEAPELMQLHGTLVDWIESGEAKADLVVIGKRGENADFASKHLGANIERVVRSCKQPVLVASRAFKPIRKVLFAYDGGVSMHKAIDSLSCLPLLKDIPCTLMRVGNDSTAARADLESAAAKLTRSGVPGTFRLVPGTPEEAIAAAVRDEDFNLLVMGAYGHSKVRHLILGSTTTTMIRTCLVPILMYR